MSTTDSGGGPPGGSSAARRRRSRVACDSTREPTPRRREAGGRLRPPGAHVVRERLVQPDVLPPAQRHQVAEPHVRHLVRDHHRARRSRSVSVTPPRARALVAEGHAAGRLQRAPVESRARRPGRRSRTAYGSSNSVRVVVEAGLGDRAQLADVAVQLGGQRARARARRTAARRAPRRPSARDRRQTTNRYVGIGGVVAKRRTPSSRRGRRPLASTVQAGSARRRASPVALRSGWSKQAKTRCARSMPQIGRRRRSRRRPGRRSGASVAAGDVGERSPRPPARCPRAARQPDPVASRTLGGQGAPFRVAAQVVRRRRAPGTSAPGSEQVKRTDVRRAERAGVRDR